MKNLKIEEIMVSRFNLETEYNTIKAYLLQKIARMKEIEDEIKEIDNEITLRSQHKPNVT